MWAANKALAIQALCEPIFIQSNSQPLTNVPISLKIPAVPSTLTNRTASLSAHYGGAPLIILIFSRSEIQTPNDLVQKEHQVHRRQCRAGKRREYRIRRSGGGAENGGNLGAEIQEALKQRKVEKEEGVIGGVAEEVKEIEWPAFRKVLGTTGVVIGIIAGSSVVLLTVNALLAEISDRVFAGKGVQDFFS